MIAVCVLLVFCLVKASYKENSLDFSEKQALLLDIIRQYPIPNRADSFSLAFTHDRIAWSVVYLQDAQHPNGSLVIQRIAGGQRKYVAITYSKPSRIEMENSTVQGGTVYRTDREIESRNTFKSLTIAFVSSYRGYLKAQSVLPKEAPESNY